MQFLEIVFFRAMGGSQKFNYLAWGGGRKISTASDRGDRKNNGVNFAQFFRPPAPVVNDTSLKSTDLQATSEFRPTMTKFRGIKCNFN